jgi:hypothetical protein
VFALALGYASLSCGSKRGYRIVASVHRSA